MIFFWSCFRYYDLYAFENCVPVILYLHLILRGYNTTLSYLQAGTHKAP
jgi:hypothetical protein